MTFRHDAGIFASVARTLGVQVDDELWTLFEHRRREASERAGADVSASVLLRALLRKELGITSNQLPFDEGWLEGYRAAYGDVMKTVNVAVHDLEREKIHATDVAAERANAMMAING
jgi:hypothetical protein